MKVSNILLIALLTAGAGISGSALAHDGYDRGWDRSRHSHHEGHRHKHRHPRRDWRDHHEDRYYYPRYWRKPYDRDVDYGFYLFFRD